MSTRFPYWILRLGFVVISMSQAQPAVRPDSSMILRELIGRGEWEGTVSKTIQQISVHPTNLRLYEILAEACLNSKSIEIGLTFLRQRLEFGEALGCTDYGIGLQFQCKKEYAQATKWFLASIQNGLDTPEVYSALTACFCRTHSMEDAVYFFTSLCHREPTNANAWYALSLVYWEARKYENIDRCIDRALRIEPANVSFLKAKLTSLVRLGRYAAAETLACSELLRKAPDVDRSTIVQVSHSLAYSQIQLGEFDKAERVLSVGTDLAKRYGFRSSLGWLDALQASLMYLNGRYIESVEMSRQARGLAEAIGDSVLEVETYIWEHQALTEMGKHDEAILAAHAAGIKSRARSDELMSMLSLVALSVSTQDLGMDSLSLRFAIEAVTRMEQYAPESYTRLLVQVRLAEAYLAVGNTGAAIDLLPDLERDVPGQIRGTIVAAIAHGVLGRAMLRNGHVSYAIKQFSHQLELARLKQFKREELSALTGLASAYMKRGEVMRAKSLLLQGLSMPAATWPVTIRAKTLGNLAEVYMRAGQRDSAAAWLEVACRECWKLLPMFDVEYQRNSLWAYFRQLVRLQVGVLVEIGRIEQAFLVSRRMEWVPIQESMSQAPWTSVAERGRLGTNWLATEIGDLLSERCEAWRRTDRLGRQTGQDFDIAGLLRCILHEARFREKLRSEPFWSNVSWSARSRADSMEVLKSLAASSGDAALIQFVVGGAYTDVFLVVESRIEHFRIGCGELRLRRLLARVTSLVCNEDAYGCVLNKYAVVFSRAMSEEVARLIVLPWLGHVRNASRLAILADGCLLSFPFELLRIPRVDSKPGNHNTAFLVEEFAVQYVRYCQEAFEQVACSHDELRCVLAFGSAEYAAGSQDRTDWDILGVERPERAAEQVRLPGIGHETSVVGFVLGRKTTVIVGNTATPKKLATLLPSADILHMAAHAAYRGPGGYASTLHLSSDSKADDGLFFAYQLYPVSIGARLVVLSGCNTAGLIGNERQGAGFAAVFHSKGVECTIGSVWAVDDEATEHLMEQFYILLSQGVSASTSLQRAKKLMIGAEGNSSPYLWAGFVMIGRDAQFAKMRQESGEWHVDLIGRYKTLLILFGIGSGLFILLGLSIRRKTVRGK